MAAPSSLQPMSFQTVSSSMTLALMGGFITYMFTLSPMFW